MKIIVFDREAFYGTQDYYVFHNYYSFSSQEDHSCLISYNDGREDTIIHNVVRFALYPEHTGFADFIMVTSRFSEPFFIDRSDSTIDRIMVDNSEIIRTIYNRIKEDRRIAQIENDNKRLRQELDDCKNNG